jgi:hypothetical protein
MEAEFSVEEVVVPLVIQHAIAPVHEMLKKSPYYLEPLVRYLDKIVGFTLVEMTAEVKYDKGISYRSTGSSYYCHD